MKREQYAAWPAWAPVVSEALQRAWAPQLDRIRLIPEDAFATRSERPRDVLGRMLGHGLTPEQIFAGADSWNRWDSDLAVGGQAPAEPDLRAEAGWLMFLEQLQGQIEAGALADAAQGLGLSEDELRRLLGQGV